MIRDIISLIIDHAILFFAGLNFLLVSLVGKSIEGRMDRHGRLTLEAKNRLDKEIKELKEAISLMENYLKIRTVEGKYYVEYDK